MDELTVLLYRKQVIYVEGVSCWDKQPNIIFPCIQGMVDLSSHLIK